MRASKVLPGPTGKYQRRPQEVHRAGPPGPLRLEDLQLRPGLRADAGGGGRARLAAGLRPDRPAVARRLHHPRRVPGADQGGLRRRPEAGEPAAWPRTSRRRSRKAQTAWRQRGGHGRAAGHSHAGLLRGLGLLRRLPLRRGCRPTCCRPSAITSAPTPTTASTAKACSTAIGCGCGSSRDETPIEECTRITSNGDTIRRTSLNECQAAICDCRPHMRLMSTSYD